MSVTRVVHFSFPFLVHYCIPVDIINDMTHTGEEVPQPIACKRYSGKFMVRVPPEIHRNLAIQASEAGVSLNRIAGAKLSR